jgi:hypothetical protein
MLLSQHDHVIETFSANTSNEPFREWILPGTLCRRQHLFDSPSLKPVLEMTAVHPVTAAYQISRCSIFWESFDDLLRRPFHGRMFGDIEMQHATKARRQVVRAQGR